MDSRSLERVGVYIPRHHDATRSFVNPSGIYIGIQHHAHEIYDASATGKSMQ